METEVSASVEEFVKGAEFIGGWEQKVHYNSYGSFGGGTVDVQKYEIYRVGSRLIKVRRFPIYKENWKLFGSNTVEKIGEDFETELVSEDKAFKLLSRSGKSAKEISDLLAKK